MYCFFTTHTQIGKLWSLKIHFFKINFPENRLFKSIYNFIYFHTIVSQSLVQFDFISLFMCLHE